ncbi:MAG: hypothetical protein WCJ35_04765, partial [Planctomycetota bacterium]
GGARFTLPTLLLHLKPEECCTAYADYTIFSARSFRVVSLMRGFLIDFPAKPTSITKVTT